MLLAKCHSFLRAERKRAQEGGKRSGRLADCSKKKNAWLLLAKGLSFLWRQEEKGAGGREKEQLIGQLLKNNHLAVAKSLFDWLLVTIAKEERRREASGNGRGKWRWRLLAIDQRSIGHTHKRR